MLSGAHAPISGFTQWLMLCLSPSATEAGEAALPKHSLVADSIKYQPIHATAIPLLVFKTLSKFPVHISHFGNCSLISGLESWLYWLPFIYWDEVVITYTVHPQFSHLQIWTTVVCAIHWKWFSFLYHIYLYFPIAFVTVVCLKNVILKHLNIICLVHLLLYLQSLKWGCKCNWC